MGILKRGWGRVGEGLGRGLGKGWGRVGEGLGRGWGRVGEGLGRGWGRDFGEGLGKGLPPLRAEEVAVSEPTKLIFMLFFLPDRRRP